MMAGVPRPAVIVNGCPPAWLCETMVVAIEGSFLLQRRLQIREC